LDQFLRAVHRRQVALAVVERAGLGLVVGCAVATVFVALVLWRGGEDAWNRAGLALAAGAVAGATAGMVRRPSVLASAGEADRQLGTADLLSTAFTLRTYVHPDDPWAKTVLALAAEQCRRHAPREVMLRRLGVRAWGGVLLAVAFVTVLTALSSASREAVAARSSGNDTAAGKQDANRLDRRPIVEMTDVAESAARQGRAELSPEDQHPKGSDVSAAAHMPPDSDGKSPARDSQAARTGASSPGVGSQATSATPPAPAAQQPGPSKQTDVPGGTAAPPDNGAPGAGVGRAAASPNPTGTDPANGGVITRSDHHSSPRAAPWTSDSWPQMVESAERQVRSGRVPDDARDLVRGYFDPTASGR
jgi:hypothetical protein